MTHHAEAERTINVPADELWKTISAMTGMEDWYPGLIRESEVLDAGSTEPHRNCIMQDGGELKERILVRDGATRTFVYAIDSHPLPARNLVGTIRIDDLGHGRSHATWSARMNLDAPASGMVIAMVNGMYEAGLQALEAHHAG